MCHQLLLYYPVFFICSEIFVYALYEERPKHIFPDDYDKYIPPTKSGEPAHIYIAVNLLDIDTIDEERMVLNFIDHFRDIFANFNGNIHLKEFSVQIYLHELWHDHRLNLTSFVVGQGEPPLFPEYLVRNIWVPDLVFDNSKDGKLFQLSLPNTAVKVTDEGNFWKDSRYNLIVSCPMDFHFYPMDSQRCFLKIATMSNADSKVLLHWLHEYPTEKDAASIHLLYEISPLKYELQDLSAYKEQEIWPDGNYTFLFTNFTFTRRMSAAIFNVYIPSTLVVLLSWISFWVDIEAVPARVTLGVTSLLTLSTQVVQARSGLPPISYMTAMDIWLFACLITVFSVLLEFAFAYQNCIQNKQKLVIEEKSNEMDFFKKTEVQVLRSKCGNGLKMKTPDIKPRSKWELEKRTKKKDLDKICRKAFPLLFSIFFLIYWLYYLHH